MPDGDLDEMQGIFSDQMPIKDVNSDTDLMNNEIPQPCSKRRNKWKSPMSGKAEKTVIVEGEKSCDPVRLGATGEISIILNSITGLQSKSEIVCDISNSKYFSNETADCEFEIGNLNVLNLMEMRFSQYLVRKGLLHFSYEREGMGDFKYKEVCSNDNGS